MHNTPIETQARHQIAERVAAAAMPRLPRDPAGRRRRLAGKLRRVADRLEN